MQPTPVADAASTTPPRMKVKPKTRAKKNHSEDDRDTAAMLSHGATSLDIGEQNPPALLDAKTTMIFARTTAKATKQPRM